MGNLQHWPEMLGLCLLSKTWHSNLQEAIKAAVGMYKHHQALALYTCYQLNF